MSRFILHERAATGETNQLRLFWVLLPWSLQHQRRPWKRSDPCWQQKNNSTYYVSCIFGICCKKILMNVVKLFCIVPCFNAFCLYTPYSRFRIFFSVSRKRFQKGSNIKSNQIKSNQSYQFNPAQLTIINSTQITL